MAHRAFTQPGDRLPSPHRRGCPPRSSPGGAPASLLLQQPDPGPRDFMPHGGVRVTIREVPSRSDGTVRCTGTT
jgi:hypothetical protein